MKHHNLLFIDYSVTKTTMNAKANTLILAKTAVLEHGDIDQRHTYTVLEVIQ